MGAGILGVCAGFRYQARFANDGLRQVAGRVREPASSGECPQPPGPGRVRPPTLPGCEQFMD
ncbi:hypothetical protein M0L20_28505 [Spirosoma sp. RP8]|uniref:Uncharacterized protein n=1 Tax=Spirosoma liriopis TaxID=2937440 RepID=A0ABT0HUJ5_9BACT|nr:hypothetical protein [Spirosoma liriopis]MCK8495841.1 hypothetical protein [Spirosoma liriopis]